jgi:hypothetical protein
VIRFYHFIAFGKMNVSAFTQTYARLPIDIHKSQCSKALSKRKERYFAEGDLKDL